MSDYRRQGNYIQQQWLKFRQSPMAIAAFLIFTAGAGLIFTLWMQPGDLTLQQAKLALHNHNPHLALTMIEPVLHKTPNHLRAQCLLAEALLDLHEFTQAQETLRQATQAHPHSSAVRELLVRWTFEYALSVMHQPEFSTSVALQQEFDALLEAGRVQAAWLLDQPGGAYIVKSRFIQACLVDLNIRRYRAMLNHPARADTRAQLVSYSTQNNRRKNLQHQIDVFSQELDGHLQAVTRLAPSHFNAWMMYIDYLSQRDDVHMIRETADKLSKRNDLPASLVARLVTSLLTDRDTSLPKRQIVETGFRLLSAVRKEDRTSVDYKLAAARLHLLNNDKRKAIKLLDEVV